MAAPPDIDAEQRMLFHREGSHALLMPSRCVAIAEGLFFEFRTSTAYPVAFFDISSSERLISIPR